MIRVFKHYVPHATMLLGLVDLFCLLLAGELGWVARAWQIGIDAGPIGALPPRGRFRWLVSPRSTIVQPSPVHTGRTNDPSGCLEKLMDRMVRRR